VLADQGEPVEKRGRGRPRKWPSETARREHEAAKRRLRNKLNLAAEEFNDVRRLTALADDLQRQVVELTEEVEALRCRERDLERPLARAAEDSRIHRIGDWCEATVATSGEDESAATSSS
jgi:hypothetical protein